MGMGIKILNRQGFHMGEKPDTQVAHRSLADIYHNPVIAIRTDYSRRIYGGHGSQSLQQGSKIRIWGTG